MPTISYNKDKEGYEVRTRTYNLPLHRNILEDLPHPNIVKLHLIIMEDHRPVEEVIMVENITTALNCQKNLIIDLHPVAEDQLKKMAMLKMLRLE